MWLELVLKECRWTVVVGAYGLGEWLGKRLGRMFESYSWGVWMDCIIVACG